MIVFILGTAGSGKTTLAKNFKEYLGDACLINLDPGNPLECDIDIRKYIKAEDIMRKYGLGPNSGIIKAVEESLNYIDKILEDVPDTNWKIVDTPGQLELFLYRDIGKEVIKEFRKVDKEVATVFLIDIQDVLKPENFLSVLAWNVIIYLRLGEKCLTVINKKDLLKEDEVKEIIEKIKGKKYIEELKKKDDSLSYLIAESFKEFYEYSTIFKRPIFISALKKDGFEDLESAILELFCTCGDIS